MIKRAMLWDRQRVRLLNGFKIIGADYHASGCFNLHYMVPGLSWSEAAGWATTEFEVMFLKCDDHVNPDWVLAGYKETICCFLKKVGG